MPQPKKNVTTREVEKIRELTAAGVAELDVAQRLNFTAGRWAALKQRDERVGEALELGLAQLETAVVEGLVEMIRSKSYTAAIRAAELILRKLGRLETDQPAEQRVRLTLELPQPMPMQEYRRLVTQPPAIEGDVEGGDET